MRYCPSRLRWSRGAKRTLGMRHFDVRLSCMVLNSGDLEMRTGEGKTLVATLRLPEA